MSHQKLCIPVKVLDQHMVMLGKTGAGKSSALRHIVEHLLREKKRVCIVDPKGDWWGLKSSADGKKAGFPVIAFGDFKEEKAQDVPINAQSGKHVAELVAGGNRPAVIGFRGWMPAAMTQFWIDFASTLFNENPGELYLVGDEFHNFAPKGKIMDPQAGKCLHWSNRLLAEGRGLGIVCLIASQRPQKVHNDTLTSCETLAAMRVIHKADRDAVKAWIDGCGDGSHGTEVLNALAGMARGEAYVWSPEIKFGPERVKFPMFETFDSFAPPQMQKNVSKAGWADVDLDEVKQKMATVIEEHKQNDPKELKRTILTLTKELAAAKNAKPAAPVPVTVNPVEVMVVTDKQVKNVESIVTRLEKEGEKRIAAAEVLRQSGEELRTTGREFAAALMRAGAPAVGNSAVGNGSRIPSTRSPIMSAPSRTVFAPSTIRLPKRELDALAGDGMPDKCGRAILSVLAQYPEGCNSGKLTLLAGYRYSGGFKNSLSELRKNGFITGGNTEIMKITAEGRALGPFAALPEGAELVNYWLTHRSLDKCSRAILSTLLQNPDGLAAADICKAAGYEYSGGFKNSLSELRTAGLLIGRNTEIMRASEELLMAMAAA